MRRCLLAIGLVLAGSGAASAAPIAWPYYAGFRAARPAEIIALGSETWTDTSDGPPKTYFFSIDTGSYGPSRIGLVSETGTQ